MRDRILLDTGPLVALLNRRDRHHSWAREQLANIAPPLHTCEAVLSEACFLLRGQQNGPDAVLDLLSRELLRASFHLEEQATRVQELMARYSNVPASLADACLVRMAELHSGAMLLTLDADFKIYRMHERKVIPTLMPQASP